MKASLALLCVLLFNAVAFAEKPLVVHEWGTFTSLQDETGRSIGYLNSSDEKIPQFVHRLKSNLLVNDNISIWSKNESAAHPDVTMRLETPVIYFHPADDKPLTLDVNATFNGGLISEFYPKGEFAFEDKKPARDVRVAPSTSGSISWKGVKVGGEVKLPEAKEHAWLAPREVDAAPVSVNGEGEKYIFYRGLGHLDAPIRVRLNKDAYDIFSQLDPAAGIESMEIQHAWQFEVRDDGRCAFRTLKPMTLTPKSEIVSMIWPPSFPETQFSGDNVAKLREQMRAALVENGLFADEAEAMLNTWKDSYFTSPGMRLFYVVPRAWTDHYLPLKFSVDAKVERVMVGRLEMVTSQQRRLLPTLANTPQEDQKKVLSQMGRFGYAIVLDELRQRPNEALLKFAQTNYIRAFAPTTQPTVSVAK